MPLLENLLAGLAVLAVAVWAALVRHVLAVQRERTAARQVVAEALVALSSDRVRGLPMADRVSSVRHVLDRSSREMLMYAAADRQTPAHALDVLSAYMVERWAGELESDALSHRTTRDKWRRIAALRILHRLNRPGAIPLLARAVDGGDTMVAHAALAMLGESSDARALGILIDALRRRRHSAARVAIHIDQSPHAVADRLLVLVGDADPVIRLWGATLLARCPGAEVERALVPLTDDPDARVRKAALQTLGRVGGRLAADCAVRRLSDTSAFVRAHAARALGELGRADLAQDVAVLLGDRDWWTRLAARESLEMMGSEIWPVLMRCLSHEDGFVRNGAAEVLQNVGVLDSLVVMEAASDNPSAAKIEMLRRIAAAGGGHFTDALIERAGPYVGRRVRRLLTTIGLEHVGASSS